MTRSLRSVWWPALLVLAALWGSMGPTARAEDKLEQGFRQPPPDCRPEVFLDWMGGLLSKEGITKDLEALAEQGVGGVMIMQLPDQLAGIHQWAFREYPGKIKCLSDEWFDLANHTAAEADRLGMTVSFFISPGWSHCGGPWITPEKSLKVLVSSRAEVAGPRHFEGKIERAPVRVSRVDRTVAWNRELPAWEKIQKPTEDFYRDVAVIAVPAGVTPVPLDRVVDLTKQMDADGQLTWDVPEGKWNVVRFGYASDNGPNHPAPLEGMGLECDRMDAEAVRTVYNGMMDRIVREARAKGYRSVRRFETDSYEAARQDFGADFQEEFRKRRGYDCTPWLPVWLDQKLTIESADLTARFRRDMLQTVSDLWIERFYGELRRLADVNDLQWMIEPYFIGIHDWRTAGARSHMPGAEFWMGGPLMVGPAPDIAALYGKRVVWAEAFTAESWQSAWRNDPWLMKPVGDAAFCQGINHFIQHGFVHNPFGDQYRPGLSMGFWGTQLNRNLTWWPYAASWHRYLARSQFLLTRGWPVLDVLTYPPKTEHIPGPVLDTGLYKQTVLNDEALLERVSVKNGRLTLPHGAQYAALSLVPGQALRPEALEQIHELVTAGATLIGQRLPTTSVSMERYPACDGEVAQWVEKLWGTTDEGERQVGSGRVIAGEPLVAALDRVTGGPDFRYVVPAPTKGAGLLFFHRRAGEADIYFVTNQEDEALAVRGDFRTAGKVPELWDAVEGTWRDLPSYSQEAGRTLVSLRFEPRQSYFVVFRKPVAQPVTAAENFPSLERVAEIDGPWKVQFDPKWGGPEEVEFAELSDWTKRSEGGIKYYSGTAVYRKSFDLDRQAAPGEAIWLDLGTVKNLARVRLNDRDLGVVWCAPWRVRIDGAVRPRGNRLEISVVNTWVNRLIGDEQEPLDCELVDWDPPSRKGSYAIDIASRGLKELPDWLIEGTPRPSKGRYTFSSWYFYKKDAPLLESGLMGPVTITAGAASQ